MMRSEEADELQQSHPKAFLLLMLIGRRARWAKDPCPVTGLTHGQAFIGDYHAAGLESRGEYRHAMKVLEKVGACSFVGNKTATIGGTKKGTTASLLDSTYFSISVGGGTKEATISEAIEHPTRQPSSGHRTTTKNKETPLHTEERNKEHPISPVDGGHQGERLADSSGAISDLVESISDSCSRKGVGKRQPVLDDLFHRINSMKSLHPTKRVEAAIQARSFIREMELSGWWVNGEPVKDGMGVFMARLKKKGIVSGVQSQVP